MSSHTQRESPKRKRDSGCPSLKKSNSQIKQQQQGGYDGKQQSILFSPPRSGKLRDGDLKEDMNGSTRPPIVTARETRDTPRFNVTIGLSIPGWNDDDKNNSYLESASLKKNQQSPTESSQTTEQSFSIDIASSPSNTKDESMHDDTGLSSISPVSSPSGSFMRDTGDYMNFDNIHASTTVLRDTMSRIHSQSCGQSPVLLEVKEKNTLLIANGSMLFSGDSLLHDESSNFDVACPNLPIVRKSDRSPCRPLSNRFNNAHKPPFKPNTSNLGLRNSSTLASGCSCSMIKGSHESNCEWRSSIESSDDDDFEDRNSDLSKSPEQRQSQGSDMRLRFTPQGGCIKSPCKTVLSRSDVFTAQLSASDSSNSFSGQMHCINKNLFNHNNSSYQPSPFPSSSMLGKNEDEQHRNLRPADFSSDIFDNAHDNSGVAGRMSGLHMGKTQDTPVERSRIAKPPFELYSMDLNRRAMMPFGDDDEDDRMNIGPIKPYGCRSFDEALAVAFHDCTTASHTSNGSNDYFSENCVGTVINHHYQSVRPSQDDNTNFNSDLNFYSSKSQSSNISTSKDIGFQNADEVKCRQSTSWVTQDQSSRNNTKLKTLNPVQIDNSENFSLNTDINDDIICNDGYNINSCNSDENNFLTSIQGKCVRKCLSTMDFADLGTPVFAVGSPTDLDASLEMDIECDVTGTRVSFPSQSKKVESSRHRMFFRDCDDDDAFNDSISSKICKINWGEENEPPHLENNAGQSPCSLDRLDRSHERDASFLNSSCETSFGSDVSSIVHHEDDLNTSSISRASDGTMSRKSANYLRDSSTNNVSFERSIDSGLHSTTSSSASSSNASPSPLRQSRQSKGSMSVMSVVRPLPDQAAFDRSFTTSSQHSSSLSPQCPATPIRSIMWHDGVGIVNSEERRYQRSVTQSVEKLGGSDKSTFTLNNVHNDHHRDRNSDSCATSSSSQPKVDLSALHCSNISFDKDFISEGQIGKGNFAHVYRVREKSNAGVQYAVKRSREQFRSLKHLEGMMGEAICMQTLGQSPCPYIVRLVTAWKEGGHVYMQLELAEKGCLKDLLHEVALRDGRVPDSTICHVLHNVASGLQHIHNCGYVHLDIKPGNLLIGSQGIVKIGDFGMTALKGTEIDGEGDARYMAAELLNVLRTNSASVVMPPADIFSLGLTLYEMCRIGQVDNCFVIPPLEGPQWHILRNGKAERVSNRPPDLEDAIALAMSPDPRSRPTTDNLLALASLEGVATRTDEVLMSAQPTTVSKIFPHHTMLGLSLSCPSGDFFQNMPLDHVLTPTASAFSFSSITSAMYSNYSTQSTLGNASVLPHQSLASSNAPSSADHLSHNSQEMHNSHCYSTVTSMESMSQPNSASRELHTSDDKSLSDKSLSFDQSSDSMHPGIDNKSIPGFKLARNNKEIVRKRVASPIDIAHSLSSSTTASESSPLVFQSQDYRRKSMSNNIPHSALVDDQSCKDVLVSGL